MAAPYAPLARRRTIVVGCMKMTEIRQAQESDVSDICSFDQISQPEEPRREFVSASVASGLAWVAVVDGAVAGYAVLEYSFYSQGFISMLYIHSDHRRNGLGSALLSHLESICKTEKLFTSTNESNRPMQGLMCKRGYVPSGVINNLDEGDPELVYFKRLKHG